MKTFWGLLKQSVLGQLALAMMFGGTTCYLYLSGHPVPDSLLGFDGLVLGFFFGAKVQQAAQSVRD